MKDGQLPKWLSDHPFERRSRHGPENGFHKMLSRPKKIGRFHLPSESRRRSKPALTCRLFRSNFLNRESSHGAAARQSIMLHKLTDTTSLVRWVDFRKLGTHESCDDGKWCLSRNEANAPIAHGNHATTWMERIKLVAVIAVHRAGPQGSNSVR